MFLISNILGLAKKAFSKTFLACRRVRYRILARIESTKRMNQRLFDGIDSENILMLTEFQKSKVNLNIYNSHGLSLLFAAYQQARLHNKKECFFLLLHHLSEVPDIFRWVAENDLERVRSGLQLSNSVNSHIICGIDPNVIEGYTSPQMESLPLQAITITLGLLDIVFLTRNNKMLHLLLDRGLQFFGRGGSSLEQFNPYVYGDIDLFIEEKCLQVPHFAAVLKSSEENRNVDNRERQRIFLNFIGLLIAAGNTIDFARILFEGYPANGFPEKQHYSPLELAKIYQQKYISNVLLQFGAEYREGKSQLSSESLDKPIQYPHCELAQTYWFLLRRVLQCSTRNCDKQSCKNCLQFLNKNPIYYDARYTREVSGHDLAKVQNKNFFLCKLPKDNYLAIYASKSSLRKSPWWSAPHSQGNLYIFSNASGMKAIRLIVCEHCHKLELEPKCWDHRPHFCCQKPSDERLSKLSKAQNLEKQAYARKLVFECESLESIFTVNASKAGTNPEKNVKDHLQDSIGKAQKIVQEIQWLDGFLKQTDTLPTKDGENRENSQANVSCNIRKGASKSRQKASGSNQARRAEIEAIEKELQELLGTVQCSIKAFHAEYEKSHIVVEQLADRGEIKEAEATLHRIRDKMNDVVRHYPRACLLRERMEYIHGNVKQQIEKCNKAQERMNRESKRSLEQSQSLTEERRQEEEKQKKVQALAHEAMVATMAEEEERHARFMLQREEYRKLRDAMKVSSTHPVKKNLESISVKPGSNPTSHPTGKPIGTTIAQPPGAIQRMSFGKKPKPLTLDRKANIVFSMVQEDARLQAEKELNLLELCMEACVEMNREVPSRHPGQAGGTQPSMRGEGNIEKIQREALLGTLARCMEVIKQIKGEKNLPQGFARYFRNYLFKSRRFLLPESETSDEAQKVNAEIIDMVNDLLHCLRLDQSEGMRLDKLNSPILKEMLKETQELEHETSISTKECEIAIQYANALIEEYDSREDINALLLFCAAEWQRAARGTLSALLRDGDQVAKELYSKSRPQYDHFIKIGNQFRHYNSLPIKGKISYFNKNKMSKNSI